MLFTILTGTFFQLITLGESLAIFEAKVVAFSNPTNRTETRQCCQSSLLATSACRLSCHTFFEICLDDLHLEEPNCMFGKNGSQIYQTSNLRFNEISLDRSITISTSLSWPGVFGFRIAAVDNSTRTLASKGKIQSSAFVDTITPRQGWKTKNESGLVSTLLYKYRLFCASNYYGLNCTIYCKPRDDDHGHYGCDENGDKYCLSGWTDISGYCKTPICTPTCQQGRCTGPNVCSCDRGWTGSTCSTCQTRVGCVNGTCVSPGGCICNSGWGGNNCDKEMDYCGMHKPCQNGGICINQGIGAFRCYCLVKFTGQRCETGITACTVNPCQNGGSCQVAGSGYKCNCTFEYTGSQCETRFDPCASFLCYNNGTCNAIGASQSCNCQKGFTGSRCESALWVSTTQSFTAATIQHTMQTASARSISASTSLSSANTIIDLSTMINIDRSVVSLASVSFATIMTSSYPMDQRSSSSKTENPPAPSSSFAISHSSSLDITPSFSLSHLPQSGISGTETTLLKELIYPTITPESMIVESSQYGTVSQSSLTKILTTKLSSKIMPFTTSQTLHTSILASKLPVTPIKKTHQQGSSKRSMAIGISVSISFVIILTVALIFLWTKFSKRRGHHKFRTSSTIIPVPMNNPVKLLDAGYIRKSSANNNLGHYHIEKLENPSSRSNRSQAISDKDINIESNSLQFTANIDCKDGYLNTCNSMTNFGYLSEGTSGYDSENSSARSSANYTSRTSKSPLSTNDILVSRFSTSNGPSEDLPNCIVYHEEYQEVEL